MSYRCLLSHLKVDTRERRSLSVLTPNCQPRIGAGSGMVVLIREHRRGVEPQADADIATALERGMSVRRFIRHRGSGVQPRDARSCFGTSRGLCRDQPNTRRVLGQAPSPRRSQPGLGRAFTTQTLRGQASLEMMARWKGPLHRTSPARHCVARADCFAISALALQRRSTSSDPPR